MSTEQEQTKTDSDTSLRLAIAMALVRSKLLQKPPPHQQHPSTSESNALKWKRKAKERKQELLRLREDLKQAEDNSQCDLFGQTANCKCYFFDNLGTLSPNRFSNDSDGRFSDVLRSRFLRQVRLNERRRKRESSKHAHRFSDCSGEDEIEQLRASVDFLVELCDTVKPVKVEETKFLNWSHQAVDFILELHHLDADVQFRIQHLIRNLGSECYVGQRVILSVSQRIAVLGESLLFIDPFDDAFPNMHDCMYMMIQLIEFLVSDYLLTWSSSEVFDTRLFEEGVTSVLHAKKALELLESRNGLYVLYMDRVIGDLGKKWGQISLVHTLNLDILANLLR
ncbi:protein MULTIPOLAR SPINDLE 1 isoform X2 [Rhododendron vialii]|uniref:protein MULTIPOLAR SPINDLE 1 isoform X2 n=1 Tax=Rhododendron vialii TaxID=182163 RepID=UPI00265F070A|nr:protein MULTIPOLAR SPINDLE 1 isoform X2 [Rhododendron vialii]